MKNITREDLKERLSVNKPDNQSRNRSYALINVLSEKDFATEHIPGSDNIHGAAEFERRFDKNKEIILYCASSECPASSQMAEDLEARGFENIITYEGGMEDWKSSGNSLERGRSSVQESRIF
jgi:rhodanese-related sulfurtransferase